MVIWIAINVYPFTNLIETREYCLFYHIWLWSTISFYQIKVINIFPDPLQSKVKIMKSYEEKKQ